MLTDAMPLLIGSCLRATVVLGLVWALTSIMRGASATTRHFIWSCAIAAALLAPVTPSVVPQWPVPSPLLFASLIAPAPVEPVTPDRLGRDAIVAPTDDETTDSRVAPSAPSTPAQFAGLGYAAAAVSLWAAGTGVLLLSMIAGAIAARWMRQTSGRLDASWVEQAHVLAEAFEIPGPIGFVESATASTPMVTGLWRPLIVMPRSAADWPAERLRVVVLHEFAHIKRRDGLTQALAQIVCAAYWFNPLVWVASRRLRVERERACDDFVLAAGTKGSDYAGHLLEIARAMRARRLSPLGASGVAMAHRSQLEGRLMAILDPAVRRSSAFTTQVASVTAVLLIAIPVAVVQVQTAPATREVRHAETISPASQLTSSPRGELPVRRAAEQATVRAGQAGPQRRAPDRASGALNRALLEAAEDGDLDGIAALLVAGANVNAEVAGDGSPLIGAARRGRLAAVGLLLDRGADPNMIVRGDGSPIIMAAREGHAGVVDLLLNRGAIVDQVAPGDENALIQASARGQLNVVKLLVARGADVNGRVWADRFFGRQDGGQDGEWRTPLNMARRSGHGAVVAYLLSLGARE
jgi:beta-lactamase regulating signal transducer with metallopeptidase domain